MIDVCFQCGAYRADKLIDAGGSIAICPECGCQHPFRRLPLFIVGGASAAGKTTLCRRLADQAPDVVCLEMDILWRPEFNSPNDNYRDFFETWLRLSKNIGQAGRPVALFGAGAGVPENIEPRVERRYFSTVYYLACVCEDEVLIQRLKQRPAWRQSSDPGFVDSQRQFNQWFKTRGKAAPPVDLLDTTRTDEDSTAAQAKAWLYDRLAANR